MIGGTETSELVEHARNLRVCASSIEDLGRRLPSSDGDMLALLEATIEDGDPDAFTSLLLAALAAGRRISDSFLRRGLNLVSDPLSFTIIIGHIEGNVVEAILEVVRGEKMTPAKSAHALLAAALWCRHRELEVPAGVVTEARILGRRMNKPEIQFILFGIAYEVNDEGLWEVLGKPAGAELEEDVGESRRQILSFMTNPVLESLPREPPPVVHSGFTVRRAVAKVGRNDPCPCGSGKKYKKCCHSKDQKRLRDSSDIAGVTREELRKRPEPYLTQDRLFAMDRHELIRVAPAEIDADLLPVLVNQLMYQGEHQAVLKVFGTVGWMPDLAGHHLDAVEMAAMDGEKDVVRALMALRPADAEPVDLTFVARLALNGDQPGPVLKAIEGEALKMLRDSQRLPSEMAFSLLDAGFPALGVLVARGAIPVVDPFEAETLIENLLKTRDQLSLPPSDPIEEVFDTLMTNSAAWADSSELLHSLEESQAELDAKDADLNRLRAQLFQLQHKIDKLPSVPVVAGPASSLPVPEKKPQDSDTTVKDLRARLKVVKAELKQRHAERNELRSAVKAMQDEIKQLRSSPDKEDGPAEKNSRDSEQDLLLPAEEMQHNPLRLAEYDPRFRADLKTVPQRVARSALRLVGGLCAGDSHAFSDARRLKVDRNLWRVRVGSKYRMLFRLSSDVVRVLSLVGRGALEKTIASLS
jgi:mRNA-degrading endonuclease RelE of RelBE toxin-antitoxin system